MFLKPPMKTFPTYSKNQRKGFTLVELLVVIAIIAVLSAIGVSAMIRYRTAADASASMSAIRQLQIANQMYATDNNGKYAPVDWATDPDFLRELTGNPNQLPTMLPQTVLDPKIYRAKRAGYQTLPQSYGYVVAGESFRISEVADPARSAAFITSNEPSGRIGYTAAPITADAEESGGVGVVLRHKDAALTVFYDGHVEEMKASDFTRIAADGGQENVFWKPDPNVIIP